MQSARNASAGAGALAAASAATAHLDRLADEASILDRGAGNLDDQGAPLRQDPDQAGLAELDEGLAHRLPADPEPCRDVLLGEHFAGPDPHRDDGVAKGAGDLPGDRLRRGEVDGEGDVHATKALAPRRGLRKQNFHTSVRHVGAVLERGPTAVGECRPPRPRFVDAARKRAAGERQECSFTRTGCFPPIPRPAPWRGALYDAVRDLPIVSPHGHTDPRWYAENEPFPDPARLFVVPDHYVFRMLYSQGVRSKTSASAAATAARSRPTRARSGGVFAEHYHLFRGTPTRLWLDHAFATLFGFEERLSAANADRYYDTHRRGAGDAGIPPARAVRALQHRGDRDHRKPARRLALAHARSATRAGTAASSPPTGPTRSSIRSSRAFRTNLDPLRRDHRQRHGDLGRLPRRPPQAPRLLQARSARPRPTTAIRPRAPRTCRTREAGGPVRGASRRAMPRPRSGAVPRPDADRDGAHEPRGRLVMQIHPGSLRNHNRRPVSTASAATRAPTSRRRPTMCGR